MFYYWPKFRKQALQLAYACGFLCLVNGKWLFLEAGLIGIFKIFLLSSLQPALQMDFI